MAHIAPTPLFGKSSLPFKPDCKPPMLTLSYGDLNCSLIIPTPLVGRAPAIGVTHAEGTGAV
jgi:hypothetical protein